MTKIKIILQILAAPKIKRRFNDVVSRNGCSFGLLVVCFIVETLSKGLVVSEWQDLEYLVILYVIF